MNTETNKLGVGLVDRQVGVETQDVVQAPVRDGLSVSSPLGARSPVTGSTVSPYGGPLSSISPDFGDHW